VDKSVGLFLFSNLVSFILKPSKEESKQTSERSERAF